MKLPRTEKTSFATSLAQMQKRCMQCASRSAKRHSARGWRSSFLAMLKKRLNARRPFAFNKRLGNVVWLLTAHQPSGFGGFARNLSSNPEQVNAYVSSNRLRDEQSVRRQDKGVSPCTRGLQANVIGAGDQKMMIEAE